ncbi:Transcriptional regulator ure2 [Rhizina undulata]
MSGQGPYYGQAAWFINIHSEKIPSAIERYINEINRHLSIVEAYFAADEPKQWLVSNKLSYADLSFIPWNWYLARFPQLEGWEKNYPLVADWDKRLNDLSYVKAAKEKGVAALAAANH